MFANYVIRAQLMAKMFARRAVYGTLGALFLLLGAVFFGAALWLYVANLYGALNANLMAGGFLVFLGLLVLLVARIPPRIVPAERAAAMADPRRSAVPPPGSPSVMTAASIAQAFVIGLTAARAFRRRG